MSDLAIPRGWTSAVLSDIAEVRLGRQRSPDRAAGPNMVPYLRAANVTWKGIDLTDVKEMDFSPTEQEVYALQDGDIVLSEASGSASEVGKPAVWKRELPLCCFQNTLIRVRPRHTSLVKFLHLHFVKDALTGRFADASRGVGIHHLGAAALSSWQVALPPAPEQARIADAVESYLSRLDDTIATLERVQRNLKRYRASVLKAAVEGRLVPTEAELARAEGRDYEPASRLLERILAERRRRLEEAALAKPTGADKAPRNDSRKSAHHAPAVPDTSGLARLPEGWCWATLEQLSAAIVDCAHSTPQWTTEGRICIRTTEFSPGRLDLRAVRRVSQETFLERTRRLKPSSGDIVYSREGGILGIACMIPPGVELCLGQRMMLIRVAEPGIARFVMAVLNSSFTLARVRRLTGGSASPHLNVGEVRAFPVPLPPVAEAERIISALEDKESIAEAISACCELNTARCARLRQSILKWAFEGKLADQDPTDEPASALLDRIRAERAAADTPKKPTSRGRPKKTAAPAKST